MELFPSQVQEEGRNALAEKGDLLTEGSVITILYMIVLKNAFLKVMMTMNARATISMDDMGSKVCVGGTTYSHLTWGFHEISLYTSFIIFPSWFLPVHSNLLSTWSKNNLQSMELGVVFVTDHQSLIKFLDIIKGSFSRRDWVLRLELTVNLNIACLYLDVRNKKALIPNCWFHQALVNLSRTSSSSSNIPSQEHFLVPINIKQPLAVVWYLNTDEPQLFSCCLKHNIIAKLQ